MGGTSTDVSLVDGELPRRTITEIGTLPIRTPCIDIHTVGAGGGSIASVDAGGSLKVGPDSAGADPGPACYGKGSAATVTDANVVLGRLRPEAFLGGDMTLDAARAERALAKLARRMGSDGAERAAEGVVRVVEGNMERAIRVITVERGQDPRDCTLVAFGGAAGLHACGLAAGLSIARILVPRDPGLLSAWGVLDGAVVRDVAAAYRAVDPSHDELERAARPLLRAAVRELREQGIAAAQIRTNVFVRLRYLGQSIELEVPLSKRFRRAFDEQHQRSLHGSAPDRPIEVTSLRASADSRSKRPRRRKRTPAAGRRTPAARSSVETFHGGRRRPTKLYDRDALAAGMRIDGPALIAEYSSTVFVADGWRALVDMAANLVMERTHDRRS
jgi:N-methylhydantoinase A